jgi:hypothetical protein
MNFEQRPKSIIVLSRKKSSFSTPAALFCWEALPYIPIMTLDDVRRLI